MATDTELIRRQKISESLKRQWASGARIYKSVHTMESKVRISLSLKQQYRAGTRKPLKSHTPETRAKMSINNAKYWLGKKRIGTFGPSKGFKRNPKSIAKFRATIKAKYDKLGRKEPLNVQIRKSLEYRLWRESVFERDNYTCVLCGAHNGNGKAVVLQADHIKSFALYPELRVAIDNGRTLCLECHRATPNYGRPKGDK